MKNVIFLMRLKREQQKKQRLKFSNNHFNLAGMFPVKKHGKHSHTRVNEVK